MAKILVADDQPDIRDILVQVLFDSGYDLIEAKDGGEAFEKAVTQNPDLVLLDVKMPVMDGFEVLRKLRENPDTAAMPVVLVTGFPQTLVGENGQLAAWGLGVRHYIVKPFRIDEVQLTVKVALLEAEDAVSEAENGRASKPWQGSTSERKEHHDQEDLTVVRTGLKPLDDILSGGVPLGSLTMIEGTPSAGKSVLCQQITYEALMEGHGVAYFTSEDTAKGLIGQMRSIGLGVSGHFQVGKLRIYPVQESNLADDCETGEDPQELLNSLAQDMGDLPNQYKLIVLDSITNIASYTPDKGILRFFSSCRRMCSGDRTIIVVAQPHAFDESMLIRLRNLCDGYFSLRVEKIGVKLGTTLEVLKIRNADMNLHNMVSFEVQAGTGMRALAVGKVRA